MNSKKDHCNKQPTKSEEAISFKSNQPESLIKIEPIELSNGPNSLTNEKLVEEDDSIIPTKENLVPSNKNDDLLKVDQQTDHLVSNKENDFRLIDDKFIDLLTPDKENDKNDQKISIDYVDEPDNIKIISSKNLIDNDEEHDGRWYLEILEKEITKIRSRIIEIEAICPDENLNNREEVDGILRSSIGKAHLLINQKLSQFKELCNKNINQTPDEPYKTLNKDLEGFYEMVSYQIDDIHKTFDEILFLKNNNWIVHNDLLNTSPRKSSKSSSRANSKPSSRVSSRNTSKEDLRRLKLREAKKKHQTNQQQLTNDDIVIFLPNNKDAKTDDL